MGTADTDDINRRWSGAVPVTVAGTAATSCLPPLAFASAATAHVYTPAAAISSRPDPRDVCHRASQKRHSTPGSSLHSLFPTSSAPDQASTLSSRSCVESTPPLPSMATGIAAPSPAINPFNRPSSGMYHGNQPQYTYSPSVHHQPPPSMPHSSSRLPTDIPSSNRSHKPHEIQSTHSSSIKSLPSIHEALGKTNPLPYPHPQSSICSQKSSLVTPSPGLIPGPSSEGPSGPINPFSSSNPSAPSLRDTILNPQPAHHQSNTSQSEGSIRSQDSQNRSIHSMGSEHSISRSSAAERTSICTSHPPTFDMLSTTTTAMSSPTSYVSPGHYGQPSYPSNRGISTSQTFPPPSFESRSSQSAWKYGVSDHSPIERAKSLQRTSGVSPYSETVKRNLDDYDSLASINELQDTGSRTLELIRPYTQRAQSSGPESIDSFLSLTEIDELLRLYRHTTETLERMRSAVVSHEQSLTEKRNQQQPFKTEPTRDKERITVFSDEFKNGNNSNGSNVNNADREKRRRKAAPPGRCHSCNRAETPEWRRGPDGARTLCNACGLHYAKLTRKAGMNKSASSSSSTSIAQVPMTTGNIRPRGGVSSRSPPLQP